MIRSRIDSWMSSWLDRGSYAGTQRSSPNQRSTPPQSPSSAAASSYARRGVEPPDTTIEPPASTASASNEATAAASAPASGWTTRSSSPIASPALERRQQPGLRLGREIVLVDAADDGDRDADLVEVVRAAVAVAEVCLEARAICIAQPALEIVRDELDDLGARQGGLATATDALPDTRHERSPSRYVSRARRTFARARWRRT